MGAHLVLRLTALLSALGAPPVVVAPDAPTWPCRLPGLANGAVAVDDRAGAVALRDGPRVLATVAVPPPAVLNTAKTIVICKGRTVEVVSEMPFSAHEWNVRLRWDGKRLVRRRVWDEDPSRAALVSARAALAAGRIAAAVRALDDMLYPARYYDEVAMGVRVLRRAHEVAQSLRRRRVAAAAAVIAPAWRYFCDAAPAGALPAAELARTGGDFARILAAAGRIAEAETLLGQVIDRAPDQPLPRIELGDLLWAGGRRDEAVDAYRGGARLLPAARLPDRVRRRCPDCETR